MILPSNFGLGLALLVSVSENVLDRPALGKGSFEKKKKKVKKDQNLFFLSDDRRDIFCRRKKNSLEKLEKFHKFGQYYEYFPSFGGQRGVPPL